ncbi:MAG: FAD:protein FMN transferase [Acidimicrobiales bacterium]
MHLPGSPVTVASVHQPVMGTTLDLHVTARDRETATAAERSTVAHALDLERRLTVFDPTSELCRWRAGEVAEPSAELLALLTLADHWQRVSEGAFNPMAGLLSRRWTRAASDGTAPSRDEMAELAASIASPRFEVADGRVIVAGDVTTMNLNALAKGFVVDRIATSAMEQFGLVALLVNAGGDLTHRGDGTATIAIEDPLRPYDNAEPVSRVRFSNAALATSGPARRWFQVGDERFNQVLDPRTGWPVEGLVSVSVLASDAATADVVATVLSAVGPAHAVDTADRLGVAALLVLPDGTLLRNEWWTAAEV